MIHETAEEVVHYHNTFLGSKLLEDGHHVLCSVCVCPHAFSTALTVLTANE